MRVASRELGTLFNEGVVGLLSDGQLLDRFVERREASTFEAIVERYGPLVWGVCRRVLRDHHDAEDAFQATFLVLARKAASVLPREKLGNWLYGVALQTAMKARATRAKRRTRERPAGEMTEPEAVLDERPDERLLRLDWEVARLPEKYRIPIILCELEGKTHRQAAEQLGWPVGTVSGRLSRARALLANRLSRPDTPFTVGALGVLLAHDVARAGVPPELVRCTAQAASLTTAGVAAGVVSAEVAALTGEVLKTMLLNKLKLAMAMLLAVFVIAAGGTSLAYRAQFAGPANQKQDLQRTTEQPKPTEAHREGQALLSPRLATESGDKPGSQVQNLHNKIVVHAKMKIDAADEAKELDGMIAVDPDSGAWERIHRLKGLASVSPDGSRAIAGKQLIDLWYAVPPRVFAPPEDGGDLIWSGDGSRLIMVYSKRGPGKNQPYKSTFWMDNDGSNPMRLGIPDTDSVVDWSRDGTAVVTAADRNRSGFGYQLYVMRPDGVGARRITEGSGLNVFARFSPDGKQVAYYRHDTGVVDVKPRIEIVNVDGTHRRTLLAEKHLEVPEYVAWSPDGNRLVVTTNKWRRGEDGRLLLDGGYESRPQLLVIDSDGRNARPLPLPKTGWLGRPVWP
jgi:RNA polymerase sigma factor (sigma-70 family)